MTMILTRRSPARFEFLMRAADVRDDYGPATASTPKVALRVLVEEFGVEKIRDWTRQVAKSR